jgi:pimeloyl-ACP methyl ester carboxylesterase
MPTAPVNDSGLEFYYEDSGALDGPYVTLVFVHGTAFTAGAYPPDHVPICTPTAVKGFSSA